MPQNGHSARRVSDALRRYEGGLTHYARRIVGDADRARDVVQETFLKLCQTDAEGLDGHLAQWLYTVCRNQALDIRRREGRMIAVAEPRGEEIDESRPEPSRAAEDREEVGSILDELEKLPTNQQECIRLKIQHGLSYREISGVTGLSTSNVGFLIHTGLKTIRRKVNRQ